MFALIARLAQLFTSSAATAENTGVAHRLMESAEARAGTNAHQAQELRTAAQAYLSVVR